MRYEDPALRTAAWVRADLPLYGDDQQAILTAAIKALEAYPDRR